MIRGQASLCVAVHGPEGEYTVRIRIQPPSDTEHNMLLYGQSLYAAEVLVSLFCSALIRNRHYSFFYAPYSDISANAETPAPEHKD